MPVLRLCDRALRPDQVREQATFRHRRRVRGRRLAVLRTARMAGCTTRHAHPANRQHLNAHHNGDKKVSDPHQFPNLIGKVYERSRF